MAKRSKVYTGSEWVDLASSATDLSNYANLTTTPISGFRNAIINGDFRVNQRGFTSTTSNGAFTFDRWVTTVAGTQTYSAPSFSPGESPSSGGINYLRIVTTAGASNYATIQQRIEDVRTFAGDTVTISFWAKAASSTPKIDITPSQNFGSGGSTSVSVTSKAVTLSTAWQRFTHTVTVPSISGKTIGTSSYLALELQVNNAFNASIGQQSNTFDIWGVQVEKGSIATPFEQRPIGTELALCQRYFQRYLLGDGSGAMGFCDTTTIFQGMYHLPVSMRVGPTMSATGSFEIRRPGITSTLVTTNPSVTATNTTQVRFTATCSSASLVSGQPALFSYNTGNPNVDFSAEL